MAFLRRLSNSFWSYISPTKNSSASLPTPHSEPHVFKKPSLPVTAPNSDTRPSRVLSEPNRRFRRRRGTSSSSQTSPSVAGSKRKRVDSPFSPSAVYPHKSLKMGSEQTRSETQEVELNELFEDSDTRAALNSSPVNDRTSPTLGDFQEDDHASPTGTLLVRDDGYRETRRHSSEVPVEDRMPSVATDALRAEGWDDDYISLIQKIARRGREPLLTHFSKFEFKFLPDGLFESTDDAFIASTRESHFRSGKEFEKLLELGSRVRDRIELNGTVEPEQQIQQQFNAYLKWVLEDARLDQSNMIPILAQEFQPAGTNIEFLTDAANRRCKQLAKRYREALTACRSTELPSPGSRSSESTVLSYPLPTLYALVASHSLIALMAYRTDVEEPEVTPMAFFNFDDPDYDVWNSLALAIIACHVRNVLVRIADETGLGQRQPGYTDEGDEDDPDA